MMSARESARMMYYSMMLPAILQHTCAPYTKPPSNAANQDLTEVLVAVSNSAANSNLCEAM